MPIYAIINDVSWVKGISQLAGTVDNPKMIEVPACDSAYFWKKWTGTEWVVNQEKIDQAELDRLAITAKEQTIIDNLSSWQEVSDAIDSATTIAALKVILKKMARVVYWLAKNKEE